MLTLATGRRNNAAIPGRAGERGVTLVELLVVLAIIALIASVVVLNAPPPASDATRASERLAARIDFAAGRAVTAGVTLGLHFDEAGYRFVEYERGVWRPASSAQLPAEALPAGIAFEAIVEDAAIKNAPERAGDEKDENAPPPVRFTPTGESTPFVATFRAQRTAARVSLDGAGGLTLTAGADER